MLHPMRPECVIVGLGNPGTEYAATRHNLGYIAVETLARHFGGAAFSDTPRFQSLTAEVNIEGRSCLLMKPYTYMNRSGEAVRKVVDFYKLNPAHQLIVLCDDIDIDPGTHRVRMSGGAGTHNGLKSIVDMIGEAFPRLRLGLGKQPETQDLATWILSKISKEEDELLQRLWQQLPTLIEKIIQEMSSAREGS